MPLSQGSPEILEAAPHHLPNARGWPRYVSAWARTPSPHNFCWIRLPSATRSFHDDWLRYFDPDEGHTDEMRKYILVDPASSKKKGSDFTVMAVIGLAAHQNYYLLEDGEIIDGHHRYCAWLALKKNEPPPTIVREGFSEQDKRASARKNNILRRHLSRAQVRQLIAQQLKGTPNWADNRIAKEVCVDGKTVEDVRDELLATSEIPKFDRLTGADGKERRNRRAIARRATGGFLQDRSSPPSRTPRGSGI